MTSTMSLKLNGSNVKLTKVPGGYTYSFAGKTYDIYKLVNEDETYTGEWIIASVSDPYDVSDPLPSLKACREVLTAMQLRNKRHLV